MKNFILFFVFVFSFTDSASYIIYAALVCQNCLHLVFKNINSFLMIMNVSMVIFMKIIKIFENVFQCLSSLKLKITRIRFNFFSFFLYIHHSVKKISHIWNLCNYIFYFCNFLTCNYQMFIYILKYWFNTK